MSKRHLLIPVLFLSGILNLSSQIIYQKWASIYLGDLYTTFIVCYFIFVLGAFFGICFGKNLKGHLSYLEILSGSWSLAVGLFIKTGFFLTFPKLILIILLFFPALVMGSFFPAYYSLFKNFKSLYFIIHLGAVAGILLLEFLFWNHFSTSHLFIIVGLLQIFLGVLIKNYLNITTFKKIIRLKKVT